MSPRRWLSRTRSRAREAKAPKLSYAEQMRIQALQEYQKKLAEPLLLSNDVLIDVASCMIAELTMRPYKTALTIHGQTFTADEFIDWCMNRADVRDQCDALFIGNELLTRGVFLPVSYGTTDAFFWTPSLKPGSATFRLVCKRKAQVVAAIYGQELGRGGEEGSSLRGGTQSQPPTPVAGSNGSKPDRTFERSKSDGVARTVSDPAPGGRAQALKSDGGGGAGRATKAEAAARLAAVPDFLEIEEMRRLKRLPRFARRAWLRGRRAWQRGVAGARAASTAAWVPVAAYLDTRIGPHVVFAVMLPFLVYYFFSATGVALIAAAWGARHVGEVDARQRRDLERRVRAEELGRFQGRRGHDKLHRDGSETADWWSEVLRSFWEGWLEFWLNRLLTRILTNVLAKVRPSYLETLEITTFRLGDHPPRVQSSRCWRGNEGETILEWDLLWHTKDMQITLSAKVGGRKFAVPVPLRVYVSDLRIAGKFRLGLFWTRRKGGPYLQKLRLSFVDMPEHSVAIKPVTSSFVDVRDLPGVDTAIENALNKLFTNLLVEPNAVTWDVERWWINRPRPGVPGGTQPGASGDGSGSNAGSAAMSAGALDEEIMSEAERIRQAKGSSISSILAAGAGYSKQPTLMVSLSVHLAEIETTENANRSSYYVKLKRGPKKYTTSSAMSVPQETMVASAALEAEHAQASDAELTGAPRGALRRLSSTVTPGHRRNASADAKDLTHRRTASDDWAFGGHHVGHRRTDSGGSDLSDFNPDAPMTKKWIARPVWEEFVRLDAFDLEVDTAVDIRVVSNDGAVVGSAMTVGTAEIPNILDYADGRLHTVQLPLDNHRTGTVVGVLHVRVRVAALSPNVIAAGKDRNPNATLLTAPKTVTTQLAYSAGDYVSQAMRRNMTNAMNAMPIPQKYVDAAASTVKSAAIAAMNEPARQGRWMGRTVYKACKKFMYGKEKYKRLKKEKITRRLEAAERAAGYAEAWQSATLKSGKRRGRPADLASLDRSLSAPVSRLTRAHSIDPSELVPVIEESPIRVTAEGAIDAAPNTPEMAAAPFPPARETIVDAGPSPAA